MSQVGKVSIVIATFQRPAALRCLLRDLASQEGEEFEVVVVDDGSTPPARAGIGEANWPFSLQIIEQDNAGPARARDTGITAARGEIIVIIDDDMRVPPNFVGAHLRAHASGADVVMGHIRAPADDDEMSLFERFHQVSRDRFVAAHTGGAVPADGSWLCTGNVSFRRDAYVEVGGFDRNLRRCEDRDLGIRFERAGRRIVFSTEAWTNHHTDHADVGTWRTRSRLYGTSDAKIGEKHPGVAKYSPWGFVARLPLVVRPILLAAAFAPAFTGIMAGAAYRIAEGLERRGRRALAVKAAGLCYGVEYFRGVGQHHGSIRASYASWRNRSTVGGLP